MNPSASNDSATQRASFKDILGGALLIAGGGAVLIAAQGYGLGTLTEMGAGYFPALIGAVLCCIGVLMLVQALVKTLRVRQKPIHANFSDVRSLIDAMPDSERETFFARLRGMVCIMGGLVAFVVLGAYGGLLPASFAVVFISALGDRDNSLRSAFLLALVMTAICVVVFWWALQLQMPLFSFWN